MVCAPLPATKLEQYESNQQEGVDADISPRATGLPTPARKETDREADLFSPTVILGFNQAGQVWTDPSFHTVTNSFLLLTN